jgi:hypothetical protein
MRWSTVLSLSPQLVFPALIPDNFLRLSYFAGKVRIVWRACMDLYLGTVRSREQTLG